MTEINYTFFGNLLHVDVEINLGALSFSIFSNPRKILLIRLIDTCSLCELSVQNTLLLKYYKHKLDKLLRAVVSF